MAKKPTPRNERAHRTLSELTTADLNRMSLRAARAGRDFRQALTQKNQSAGYTGGNVENQRAASTRSRAGSASSPSAGPAQPPGRAGAAPRRGGGAANAAAQAFPVQRDRIASSGESRSVKAPRPSRGSSTPGPSSARGTPTTVQPSAPSRSQTPRPQDANRRPAGAPSQTGVPEMLMPNRSRAIFQPFPQESRVLTPNRGENTRGTPRRPFSPTPGRQGEAVRTGGEGLQATYRLPKDVKSSGRGKGKGKGKKGRSKK